MTTAKKATLAFKTGETVVYPAHGLGLITAVEQQEVAGFRLQVFVIFFEKDRMTVRVPIAKVASVGMRKIAEPALVEKALVVLTSRARVKRGMWSRDQEYEAKIKSGDLISVAEVVRDLYRSLRRQRHRIANARSTSRPLRRCSVSSPPSMGSLIRKR